MGVEAAREGLDPVEEPGAAQDVADLVVGGGGTRQPDVLADRGVEQVGVLGAEADDPADVVAGEGAQVHTVEGRPPPAGSRKRSRTDVSVVLPDPLGPTIAQRRPGIRSREMPSRAYGASGVHRARRFSTERV